MLSVLLASGLPPPTATAQEAVPSPVLCFDRDPAYDPTRLPAGGECPGGFPKAPNYLQRDPVAMRIHNVPEGVDHHVRLRCKTNCHELAGVEYWGLASVGEWLRFPQDFDKPGPFPDPTRPARSAKDDKAGRYNGTWESTVLVGNQEFSRTFNIWLYTGFKSANLTIRPGEQHEFRSFGFGENATIDLKIQRLDAQARYVDVPLPTPPKGEVLGPWLVWTIPPDEALRMRECPATATHCYRVLMNGSATDKANEAIGLRVATADLLAIQTPEPAGDAQATPVERSQRVDVALSFYYPGGRLGVGKKLLPDDLPPAAANQQPFLRVLVEKTNVTGANPVVADELTLRYVTSPGRWETTWNVSRDLPLEADAVYRLRLLPAEDKWGNRVPAMSLGNFTIRIAKLGPHFLGNETTVPRTDAAQFAFDVRYHNGSLLTDAHNATPIRGCFFRDQGGATPPCTNATANHTAKFVDDKWVFEVAYPRDYKHLGAHRFQLLANGNARDKWGNEIVQPAEAWTYDVVAGAPQIDFTTTIRGHEVDTLDRGSRVSLSARITYADGAPFNHTVREEPNHSNSTRLNVTLIRRGADGAVHHVEDVILQEWDVREGLWIGSIELGLDDASTPKGRYTFRFDVKDKLDVPNANLTEFHRDVVPAHLRFTPVTQPHPAPRTGDPITFRYQLHYATCAMPSTGCPVRSADVGTSIHGQVYRFDAKERKPVGEPLSGILRPDYTPETNTWSMRYVVAPRLFEGSYVIVLSGHDASGNNLPPEAASRAFQPFSPTERRAESSPPAPEVRRGEAATVTFTSRPGDVGPNGTGAPAIRVERWNTEALRWDIVTDGFDVRRPREDVVDHFGVYHVRDTTSIGTYRFVLDGRDNLFHAIEGASGNFTVAPTTVTRAVYLPPPEQVEKGSITWMHIEYQPGDRVTGSEVLRNLRAGGLPSPSISTRDTFMNVSWRVPFDAQNGNYTIRISGRDQFGNDILIDSPPMEALATPLEGKVLGQPSRTVARGEEVKLLFGVTYPSGQLYAGAGAPTVYVANAEGVVASASVVRVGGSFEATWLPDEAQDAREHWFVVEGESVGGNGFPQILSRAFQIQPGSYEREGADRLGGKHDRLSTVTWSVPLQQGDAEIGFEILYYGAARDQSTLTDRDPITVTPLPHTVEPESGRYTVRFVTDERTPLGGYVIRMQGKDVHDNAVHAVSSSFLLAHANIAFQWADQPRPEAFVEGAPLKLTFTARYQDQRPLDPANARLSAFVNLAGQQTNQRPDVAYVDGRWTVTWEVPEVLTPGSYTLVVRGTDAWGNVLSLASSTPYRYDPNLTESFAKTIPGPDALLVLVGIAVALGLARVLVRRS